MTDLERFLSGRMGRRDLFRMAGATTVGAAVLAACKKAESGGGAGGVTTGATGGVTRPPIEEEPGGLQVFDWSGYGNGDYYPKEEKQYLWKQYQDATGDAPEFILFENDDVGYTEVVAGARYDVVHPCGYRFPDYTAIDVLQPWDTSLISNFGSLNPTLQQVGQIDGQQYFIVEDWGFIAPMYRADKVEPLEDSWSLLWDDRYEGKISWIDTLEMLSIAGYYHQVSDPWDMTDEELAEMRDFLISKKPLVRYFWNQSYELFRSFKQEEIWIAYAWPDAFANALTSGLDVAYMEPKEKRIIWACGLGLFKDSQNYHHAHAYADSWSSTEAAEFMLGWYYYGHANQNVDLSLIPPEIVKAFSLDDVSIFDPSRSELERWYPRRDVYAQYWAEVLAA
jgi:spermidine/putrescine transport system substrate-binding protein